MSSIWQLIKKYQSLILVVVVWQLMALSGLFSEQLFPGIEKIAIVFLELLPTSDLWSNIGITLYRILAGFALAAIVGVPLGIAMSRSRTFDNIMQPIFTFGYPVPRVALYPIFVLIFGIGSGSKIFTIFLECIFPIVVNTYYGAKRVNILYIWSGQNMGADKRKLFWRVFLPGAMPSIFTGFRIALPIGVVIAVLTEMISSSNGIGYLLTYLSASLSQSQVLAVVVYISLIGYALDRLLLYVRNRFVYWS
ncbi:ABC transporter permease [Alteribacillus iranensis]|uniref:NitT/TauT family transport system permease protein n=1 Tax=Alteribacillus iranensis TaxID=930128 RepID=A0A1I2F1H3_9BACI|nr:ABC transporter permease [Alteribacillus iranensis]SFE98843.1 NitT/TauT family transport system permease protein [Alteribacillus iranensis]